MLGRAVAADAQCHGFRKNAGLLSQQKPKICRLEYTLSPIEVGGLLSTTRVDAPGTCLSTFVFALLSASDLEQHYPSFVL